MSKDIYQQLEEGKARNAKLDLFLQTTDSIPDNLWRAFDEAIGYDSATPVQWAVKRLKVLYLRTENGESISVPFINAVLSKDTFDQVISEWFSPFIYEHILEHVNPASVFYSHNKV
jgi:hypothetical protein